MHDINLNAPKHKFALSLRWSHPEHGLTAQTRFRFVDAFEMDSPFFGSNVHSYRIIDLNVVYRILEATRLSNIVSSQKSEGVEWPGVK